MLPSLNGLKEKVWKVKTVPKIRVFLWKALSCALPTSDLIYARGMRIDLRCQTCGDDRESINHVLFSCCFARQVWALSPIPSKVNGFDHDSVFANMSYLLHGENWQLLTEEQRRVWPWIVWNLWKRRNEMLFGGSCLDPLDLVKKATTEANEWSLAQVVEEEWIKEERQRSISSNRKWKPPDSNWVKCNIGMELDKGKSLVGGAWVLRNERGVVLCHSRRAFSGIKTRDEARLVVVLWALESMRSQRQSRIVFEGEFKDLFGAAERPQAWPSFLYQGSKMEKELSEIRQWKLSVISREANRGAFFIAQSVTKYGLINSYVAAGHPPWLFELFVNESRTL